MQFLEGGGGGGGGAGADPGAGKGRGTNRVSCRWLGRARFSAFLKQQVTTYSSVSLLIFAILAFSDGCEAFKSCFKGSKCLKQQQLGNYF